MPPCERGAQRAPPPRRPGARCTRARRAERGGALEGSPRRGRALEWTPAGREAVAGQTPPALFRPRAPLRPAPNPLAAWGRRWSEREGSRPAQGGQTVPSSTPRRPRHLWRLAPFSLSISLHLSFAGWGQAGSGIPRESTYGHLPKETGLRAADNLISAGLREVGRA